MGGLAQYSFQVVSVPDQRKGFSLSLSQIQYKTILGLGF